MVEQNRTKREMTVKEAGKKGGLANAANHLKEHFVNIGKRNGRIVFERRGREFFAEIGRKGGGAPRRRKNG